MPEKPVEYLSEQDFGFLKDIQQAFPSFIGGVIADQEGLVVAACKERASLDEDIVAVSLVSNRNLDEYYAKMGFEKGSFIKVKRELSDNLKLCLLLNKDPYNLPRFKHLRKILERKQI